VSTTRYDDEESGRRVPRWVKLAAIIAAVVALLVIVVMLIGGGGHTPRRHGPPADTGTQSQPADVPGRHAPPSGAHN
jgi:hypothetical protein